MLWKRSLDILLGAPALIVLAIPIALIAILVRATSPGPAIHWSNRVGRYNRNFRMPKFRTMYTSTPDLPTHLLQDPGKWITPVGRVLRKTSLDELPQLWSVVKGDMSLVGPRPALHNQDDLVALRTARGVDRLRPGITGWAQINGRDELPIPVKAELDAEYLARSSLWFDLRIIFRTFVKVFGRDGVSH